MSAYNINLSGDVLSVGFGEPAQNDQIVKDALARLRDLEKAGVLSGGKIIKINGPASLPVACVLAAFLKGIYGAVGVWDPKLSKYVVSISNSHAYGVGDLID